MKNIDLQYLLNFLEQEFRGFSDVRIRPLMPSGTKRSIDLPQDYDPNHSSVHRTSGVMVNTKTREYYFPEEWARTRNYSRIQALAEEIRESLLMKS